MSFSNSSSEIPKYSASNRRMISFGTVPVPLWEDVVVVVVVVVVVIVVLVVVVVVVLVVGLIVDVQPFPL